MENMTPEVKEYLKTLPISVQTAVIESDAHFETVEQLKAVAAAYMTD